MLERAVVDAHQLVEGEGLGRLPVLVVVVGPGQCGQDLSLLYASHKQLDHHASSDEQEEHGEESLLGRNAPLELLEAFDGGRQHRAAVEAFSAMQTAPSVLTRAGRGR